MKKFFNSLLTSSGLLVLLIGMVVISGCGGSGNKVEVQKGTLVLNISESEVQAKSIQPGLDMTIATYDISGTGPNGTSFQKDNIAAGAPVTINALAVGVWTISVNAKNSGGTIIASGVSNVLIAAEVTNNTEITVRPLTGTGELRISISWPAGIITNPSIIGTLTPVGGSATNITFTIAGNGLSASYQNNAIPAGYYTLLVQLKDGSVIKWGGIESVRIIAGQTSSGEFPLTTAPGEIGDIELVINPDLQNPISISFSGQQENLTIGTNMTVTATPSQAVDSYQWYLNGILLLGQTGQTITIGSSLAEGSYRLDVVIVKGNITSSGYITFEVISTFEFLDNFELYTIGYNPTEYYDFQELVDDSGNTKPDIWHVDLIGQNKVLKYDYHQWSHYGGVRKIYKQVFSSIKKVSVDFLETTPIELGGWNHVLFEIQDNNIDLYDVRVDWNNILYLFVHISNWQELYSIALWSDTHILEISHRIEVERQGDKIIVKITRLDTKESKTMEFISNSFNGYGRAGFGVCEDYTQMHCNVDNFYVKGTKQQ
ncbi:MAG: hypothetical protein K6U80_20225 [Firmicutes bacterium]|nr:hypothetical protein [Bacillota bacterium]